MLERDELIRFKEVFNMPMMISRVRRLSFLTTLGSKRAHLGAHALHNTGAKVNIGLCWECTGARRLQIDEVTYTVNIEESHDEHV